MNMDQDIKSDITNTIMTSSTSTTSTSSTSSTEVKSLDEVDDGSMITLITNSGKTVEVLRSYAQISGLIKTLSETDKTATEFDLKEIKNDDVINFIIEYMNHHKGKETSQPEKPLRSKVMKEVLADPWDADFIDGIGENRQNLYDLILAANYMDIKTLLHIGASKVASLIKGQPIDKIKDILSKNPVSGGDSTTTTTATTTATTITSNTDVASAV